MKVLLCGASGFVGRNVRAALQAQGHTVVGAGTRLGPYNQLQVNYARDTDVAAWLPRLQGIDAVVNAVGVLRDSAAKPIDALHTDAPKALFDACAQLGVRRVVQVSALGVAQSDTRYARTKRAADDHLLALHAAGRVQATVLRPSIVFCKGGASSQMFVALSQLPLVVLPQPVLSARVQPIAVQDLARGIALLVAQPHAVQVLDCVGSTALSLGDFIASLRQAQGRRPAAVWPLPQWATLLSARIGDQIPALPWCTEALTLLGQPNVSADTGFAGLIGNRVPLAEFWTQAWLRPVPDAAAA
jgi:uncharacterized protein YbjT (DUF2867 family)